MKTCLILLAILLLPAAARAATVLNIPLRYDNGRITVSGQPSVDSTSYISSDEFAAASAVSQGAFRLTISDMYDQPLVDYRFQPEGGAFTLRVPYYSTVKSLSVTSSVDGSQPAGYDLRPLATCFPNSVCEYEKGETEETCLADCGVAQPRFSAATRSFLKEQGGVLKDSQGTILLEQRGNPTSPWLWPLVGAGSLLIIIAIFLYAKKRRSLR